MIIVFIYTQALFAHTMAPKYFKPKVSNVGLHGPIRDGGLTLLVHDLDTMLVSSVVKGFGPRGLGNIGNAIKRLIGSLSRV